MIADDVAAVVAVVAVVVIAVDVAAAVAVAVAVVVAVVVGMTKSGNSLRSPTRTKRTCYHNAFQTAVLLACVPLIEDSPRQSHTQ